jgi:hypothetical protein
MGAQKMGTNIAIQRADNVEPPGFVLSGALKRRFDADGFVSIDNLVLRGALDQLRFHYDRIIRGEIDCGSDNALLGGKFHHIMFPSKYEPYFLDNPVLQAGKVIAKQLLDHEPKLGFDFIVDKPPRTLSDTPWHQDYAYIGVPCTPAGTEMTAQSLQFWVALDDVDLENGCMQFLPELHRQPLKEHRLVWGDPASDFRSLVMNEADTDPLQAVACPLPAGGCTIHAYGTPHKTGGNYTTDRGRRAYVFNLV